MASVSQDSEAIVQLSRFPSRAMFEDLIRKIEDLDGSHQIPFSDLFTDEFMLLNTEYCSISDMIEASGFSVQSSEDFAKIPDGEWDRHVCQHSRFPSWEEMKGSAVKLWVSGKLGLQGT
jgi:hypothetical protein